MLRPQSIFMHSILTAVVALTMGYSPSACAQTIEERLEASPRHLEWVTISTQSGDSFSAFVAHPESDAATSSVVVIHDIRAMSTWIRLAADELAQAGFLAVVPDLLSGKGPSGGNTESFESGGDVGRAIRALDPGEVTARLKACVKYARDLPSTNDTVSVGGFCWGGTQTFRFVTNEPTLSAGFVFYGSPPAKVDMARIECPVYGFYAENDNRINSTLDQAKANMAELDKPFEPIVYSGVGHGFIARGMSDAANETYKARTQEAWERWTELLK